MPKIAMIGAGSVVFTKNLLGDILSFDELKESEIALMDIDAERLKVAGVMAERVAEAVEAKPSISTHEDRRAALEGADFVINMIQVGGYPSTMIDFDIPKKYGLRATIADTLGIGGIFRSLRTIPVMLDMGRDMKEVCPDCLFLNYVNPMAMNTWAFIKATGIQTVGLCHSVQGTAWQLSNYMGIPTEEVQFLCAGINHMAFYLKLEREGEDLYPKLRQAAEDPEVFAKDKVRFEMFKRLGYFVTESSEHFAEYVPHFIRSQDEDLIDRYSVPLDEYPRRCVAQNEWWENTRDKLLSGDEPLEVHRSAEYGSLIIHSVVTDQPRLIYGNVLNTGLITSLPDGCCVEVPCYVDHNGIQPCYVGALPPQLTGYIRTNINVQELTVEAALTGNRDHVYHAALLDPLTRSELNMDQIYQLCDELFDAHGDMIPEMA
ncbi:MAG: alpha-galactosidase [Armatimonadia bacterium]|nr:alpha-galactosidase [Armatimonadia bacterium]